MISKRHNVAKLVQFSLPEDGAPINVDSRNAALGVLTQLVQLYSEKRKEKESKKKGGSDDSDEETTLQQNSDEEDETSEGSLVNLLAQSVSRIVAGLDSANKVSTDSTGKIETSYESQLVPLGSLRLRLIELLFQILKLNKDTTNKALLDSNFFGEVSNLLHTYPWNNFLQLKVIAIYEELMESWSKDFQKGALVSSNIG